MKKLLTAVGFIAFFNTISFAQAVGTHAPDFTHNTLDHGQVSLSDHQGKVVYLFFFGWG